MREGTAVAIPIEGSSGTNAARTGEAKFIRLSSPAPGRSLGGTVTQVERPIRAAVELLAEAMEVDDEVFNHIFSCTIYGPEGIRESKQLRLTWFVVAVALSHALVTRRETINSLRVTLEWFLGDRRLSSAVLDCFSDNRLERAELELSTLRVTDEVRDLLPYIIEPHGHVTRNALETCGVAKNRRTTKKHLGVYYTPSDVANFMVNTLASMSRTGGSWLDPACGTGVFLKAILENQFRDLPHSKDADKQHFALAHIYGLDKSALATDLAAFVLLVECATEASQTRPLFALWQKLKRNLICVDSLRLIPRDANIDLHRDAEQLADLGALFPSIGTSGFDHVVMNPPYARVPIDKGLATVWHSLSGMRPGQLADTHLAFTEMLWRLTARTGVSAGILPLSVGANTSKQCVQLRDELLARDAANEFLFFDREPQALFGEDIKTRSLILFHQSAANHKSAKTSRLLKWTAEQRHSIFTRDRLICIDPDKCRGFVPKLGSNAERTTYEALTSAGVSMQALKYAPFVGRMALDEATRHATGEAHCSLLVGSTAYNFLNCFFLSGVPKERDLPYSSSPMNALVFGSQDEAFAAYALLSGRLAFWLWHVEGDGFHVTGEFLRRLPLWRTFGSTTVKDALARHGRDLWEFAQHTVAGAINGGKRTYSFQGSFDSPAAKEVERRVLNHLTIEEHFSRSLDDFVHATVSVDGRSRVRRMRSNIIKTS